MPLILAPYDLSNPHQVRSRMRSTTHQQLAYAYWAFDPTEYFARVTAATLLVVAVPPAGEIIHFVQFRLDQARSMLPDARLVILRDTYHDLHWHRPRELVAVLNEFL
jgi:pimeloyl-ACP methyl ester carboxylesterase